jgi:hypothetical protein
MALNDYSISITDSRHMFCSKSKSRYICPESEMALTLALGIDYN